LHLSLGELFSNEFVFEKFSRSFSMFSAAIGKRQQVDLKLEGFQDLDVLIAVLVEIVFAD